MYVDPELLLVPWLTTTLGAPARTTLPADLAGAVPLIQVSHIGGADTIITLAELTIDIDYYAATKPAASLLARRGHHAVRFQLRGEILAANGESATVTGVRPVFLPRPDPGYDNPDIFRYLSSYSIGFKTRPAS